MTVVGEAKLDREPSQIGFPLRDEVKGQCQPKPQ
jgi:hypothetical protein